MNRLFWSDYKRNIHIEYLTLIHDLNMVTASSKVIRYTHENPYQVFLSLLFNILNGIESILIDEFALDSIDDWYLKNEEEMILKRTQEITSVEHLINQLQSADWKINLYTSGTTGIPKLIRHNANSLLKFLKVGERYTDNVWALAFNPVHIAGIQVFFQALYNYNPICYLFDANKSEIQETLALASVTHISATSTFYRLMLPYMKEKNYTVKKITFGGELFDSVVAERLLKIFPSAKISNIYASTELGSLFISNGDHFLIPDEFISKISVNDNNELLVHIDFLTEPMKASDHSEWYNTGDVVSIDQNRLSFLGRITDFINVGGYKVNPHKIEALISSFSEVVDVRVYGQTNSVLGNVIIADIIVFDFTEQDSLREKMKTTIQQCLNKWERPIKLNFVSQLAATTTGKKVR